VWWDGGRVMEGGRGGVVLPVERCELLVGLQWIFNHENQQTHPPTHPSTHIHTHTHSPTHTHTHTHPHPHPPTHLHQTTAQILR